MKLYEDEQYQILAKSVVEDPSIATILADWLEESPCWGSKCLDYIAHLRGGSPTPKELDDCNWKETFAYAGGPGGAEGSTPPKPTPPGNTTPAYPFTRHEVKRIIAKQDGDNDGPDWVAVGELWDGRFFVVRAGCDYTGWG